jgi:hypothetical protein
MSLIFASVIHIGQLYKKREKTRIIQYTEGCA